MDEKSAHSMYEQKIDQSIQSLLPNGVAYLTESRLRHVLEQISQTAFQAGEHYALLSLMDIEQTLFIVNQRLAIAGCKPISKRHLQAIAQQKHDRFGIGYNVNGTHTWLFRPSEINSLIPKL